MSTARTCTAVGRPIDRRSDDLVGLLTELIAAASVTGTSGEASQRICGDYLAAAGYDVRYTVDDPETCGNHPEYTPAPPGQRPVNMIATSSRVTGRSLALIAHVDTEPVHAGWSGNPLRPVCRDGRLYALGAADDKGGLVAAVIAAAVLNDLGAPPPIVLSVHAKGGGSRGTLPAIERLPPVSGVVYVHPAETGRGMTEIKRATRGVFDFSLAVRGWHGAAAEIGTSESARFSDGGDALGAIIYLLKSLRRMLPLECELNVGCLNAGERAGVVPLDARAEVRVLFDEPQTSAALAAAIDEHVRVCERELQSEAGAFVITGPTVRFRANPASTDWDDPLCRAVRAAVHRVTGIDPDPYCGHLASDLRFPLRVRGIPAVGLGCRAGGFYGADEWVDLEDLRRLVAVLVTVAQCWHDAQGGNETQDVNDRENR